MRATELKAGKQHRTWRRKSPREEAHHPSIHLQLMPLHTSFHGIRSSSRPLSRCRCTTQARQNSIHYASAVEGNHTSSCPRPQKFVAILKAPHCYRSTPQGPTQLGTNKPHAGEEPPSRLLARVPCSNSQRQELTVAANGWSKNSLPPEMAGGMDDSDNYHGLADFLPACLSSHLTSRTAVPASQVRSAASCGRRQFMSSISDVARDDEGARFGARWMHREQASQVARAP